MYARSSSYDYPHAPRAGLGLWMPGQEEPVATDTMGLEETGALEATLRDNVYAARAFLRERWADFLNLGPRIVDLQHRAALVAQEAGERGDLEAKAQAQDVIRALGKLNVAHGKAVDTYELERVGEFVGLGAVPIVPAAVVTSLALVVVWAFRSYEVQERKLDMIEAGYDAAAVAAVGDAGPSPTAFLGGVGELGKLLLWGAVAWLAVQAFQASKWADNPPLEVWHLNPPGTFGEEVYDVRYRHLEDGLNYIHEFGPGVELEALPDGSVRLYHARGLPLWEDFDV